MSRRFGGDARSRSPTMAKVEVEVEVEVEVVVVEHLPRHLGLLDAGDEPHGPTTTRTLQDIRRRLASAARPNRGDTSTAPTSTSATLPATTGAGTSASAAARRVVQRHHWSTLATLAGGRPCRAGGSSARRHHVDQAGDEVAVELKLAGVGDDDAGGSTKGGLGRRGEQAGSRNDKGDDGEVMERLHEPWQVTRRLFTMTHASTATTSTTRWQTAPARSQLRFAVCGLRFAVSADVTQHDTSFDKAS
jgi:hypothetical protein